MAGGGGSPVASVMGQIDAANRPGTSTPGYVAPTQLSQGTRTGGPGIGPVNYLASQPAPQQMSPLVQQTMQRQMPQFNPIQQMLMQRQMMGLPAALMQMQGRLNQPMMRGPMPVYQNPALAYRPNMAPAQQALNRVQPSVYKTDLDAARARVAELEAQQQQQQQNDINYSLTYGYQP